MRVITSRRHLLQAALAAAGSAAVMPGRARAADAFPSRPIRLICPFPPGPSIDAVMRAMANSARRGLGGTVVVENKAGAGGILGAVEVAAAKPDGYTLTEVPDAFYLVSQMEKVSYDPMGDFTFIICMIGTVYGLAVPAASPFHSLNDMIAYARANPGKLTYSTAGVGTMNHIIMESLAKRLGIEWVHVPYRGATPAVMAVLSNEVMAVSGTTAWAPFVDESRMRLLVTYGSERTKRWGVPTLRDLGYDLVSDGATGFAGPKGMDPDVVKRLHDAFKDSLDDPAVQQSMQLNSMPLYYRDTAGYTKLARELYADAQKLIGDLGWGAKG